MSLDEEDNDYTVDCSEEEFHELTERLLDNDENNCSGYFRYNLQERRKGCEDVCDEPLFQVSLNFEKRNNTSVSRGK